VRRRRALGLALPICAAGLALALPLSSGDTTPPRTTHTLYVSAGGQDSARCGSARTPCASFNTAYRLAPPGATVLVAAGAYPAQTIEGDSSKRAAAHVLFRPAPDAAVQIAGPLHIYGSHVTFADMRVQDVVIGNYDQTPGRPNPSGVTLAGVSGRDFEIDSATDVKILAGSWGPASSCGGPYGGGNNSIRDITGVVPSKILIEGVTIHDVQSYNLSECHIEGLAIFAGYGVTVRHSKFYGNSVYDAFVQANSGPISDVAFVGNWMAMPVGLDGVENGTVIGFSDITANVLLENNRFNYIVSLDDDGLNPVYRNFRLIGNVGVLPYLGCTLRGIVWRRNVWRNGACSRSDLSLHGRGLPYVSPANSASLDYTLTRAFQRRHPGL
jgi:hypothetical protein